MNVIKRSKKGMQKQLVAEPKRQVILIRDLNAGQSKALDEFKTEISEKTATKAVLRLLEQYPLQKEIIADLRQENYKLLQEKEELEDTIAEFKRKIKKFQETKQMLQQCETDLGSLIK